MLTAPLVSVSGACLLSVLGCCKLLYARLSLLHPQLQADSLKAHHCLSAAACSCGAAAFSWCQDSTPFELADSHQKNPGSTKCNSLLLQPSDCLKSWCLAFTTSRMCDSGELQRLPMFAQSLNHMPAAFPWFPLAVQSVSIPASKMVV